MSEFGLTTLTIGARKMRVERLSERHARCKGLEHSFVRAHVTHPAECALVPRFYRFILGAVPLACASEGPAEGVSAEPMAANASAATTLVDAARWQPLPKALDPFGARERAELRCGLSDIALENGGLEISTEACNYVTLAQPLRGALAQGERVRWVMWWQTLASVTPALGRLALAINTELLWEREVLIPGPADVVDEVLSMPAEFPSGATIYVHVSNHGYNSWNVNLLERTP